MSLPAATAPSSSGATQPTEQQGGSRERRVESLGWLTESAVMPKKHKAIEGVGAASILDLKAQLYRTQEEARNPTAPGAAASGGEFRRAKIRSAPTDPLGAKNSGVESRAHKDKLELKAVKDGSASYAALEKKAELYEKLYRGELPDEEDKEKYCVDFFQKSSDRIYEPQMPEISHRATDAAEPVNDHEDSMPNAKPLGLGRAGTTIDRDEHKRFVREVHEEVTEARQKASTVRSRRQEQDAARREKLRQAYLKKRLEKLIAEKQASSASDDLPS
ncbi:uncharacterized protein At4g18257 [Zea mays]|uniref:Cytochrome b561/ferric reductase transmembrane protein family n=1 Tax=Zea mays TaxID=4577 RepID=A0A1D6NGD5_MAIZE|nr:uncharacterized protein At4g18257 [Zea mays]ONM39495.1 Cytochrome b561/ferric reductase transmembrane protein family [Zea mays]|eukprot:XP_008675245.1 uncharacterized protein At4g18257 [Zea mays]